MYIVTAYEHQQAVSRLDAVLCMHAFFANGSKRAKPCLFGKKLLDLFGFIIHAIIQSYLKPVELRAHNVGLLKAIIYFYIHQPLCREYFLYWDKLPHG
jgi:hypothetical protein